MTASSIDIRKLGPELTQDILRFFDGETFADNPVHRTDGNRVYVRRSLIP